jgi:hypothetical protein
MTENADAIPSHLSEAFHHAVWLYDDWSYAMPELEVSIDRKPYSMSAVCGLVDNFSDPFPDQVFDRLFSYMRIQHRHLKERLWAERTYSAAARCLRELIEDRKAEYRRLEELRRNR